jgi:glyoxylase-like metal-dependent hydrolase (beta-lactamase superfamily II)
VKLTSGNLAVFSPVALTDDVKAKVKELGGTLSYIVALDFEHHIFISEWKKEYPEAKIIGPEGLPEKRAKQVDEKIQNDEFFGVFKVETKKDMTITPEFDADFEYEFVDSHPNLELVFCYKPDRVLIEADLLFNLPAKEQYSRVPGAESESQDFANRLFQSLQKTEGDLKWARRFQWYVQGGKNRDAYNASLQRIDTWDFDILIPCHGDTIEGGAKDRFRSVMEWHLAGKKL